MMSVILCSICCRLGGSVMLMIFEGWCVVWSTMVMLLVWSMWWMVMWLCFMCSCMCCLRICRIVMFGFSVV